MVTNSIDQSKFPKRFYVYEGPRAVTYYHIDKHNQRINLGHDLDDALLRYEMAVENAEHADTRGAAELWKSCRKSAVSRKLQFSLTVEDVESMLKRSSRRCEVTGIPFSNAAHDGMRIRPWRASVDRLNSSIGYSPENCRLVCASVNIAMNQFGETFFHSLVIKLRKAQRAKET